ncbi:hypothetical protein [Corynebacterium aquatimens]|uniref:Uncharacterized protein n=1 Tax=Corynebacterium aquatimens TaxID=1190508 RepID=A0A931E0X2_9CORY|nr:hypothetical protein [Corynebacterium aquatimens]MBG6121600.1 hypothetical protein [Corynebacterium aquatimens]
MTSPMVSALPPGGASPNTPGTSSKVWPSQVKACETVNWEVRGFPPGEIAYVKVDDGMQSKYDQTVQGTGVISEARINTSGVATGSFQLDCATPPGNHWLRFLATENLPGDRGQLGYSHRSPDFTVPGASGGGSGGGGGNAAQSGGGGGNAAQSGGGQNNAGRPGNGGLQGQGAQAGQAAGQNQQTGNGGTNRGSKPAAADSQGMVVVRRGGGGAGQAAGPAGAQGAAGGNRGAGAAGAGGSSGGPASGNAPGGRGAQNGNGTSGGNGAPDAPGNAGGPGGDDQIVAQSPNGDTVMYDEHTGQYYTTQNKPVFPLLGGVVSGSILLVGFSAIGAYLWVNRRPKHQVVEFEDEPWVSGPPLVSAGGSTRWPPMDMDEDYEVAR